MSSSVYHSFPTHVLFGQQVMQSLASIPYDVFICKPGRTGQEFLVRSTFTFRTKHKGRDPLGQEQEGCSGSLKGGDWGFRGGIESLDSTSSSSLQ